MAMHIRYQFRLAIEIVHDVAVLQRVVAAKILFLLRKERIKLF